MIAIAILLAASGFAGPVVAKPRRKPVTKSAPAAPKAPPAPTAISLNCDLSGTASSEGSSASLRHEDEMSGSGTIRIDLNAKTVTLGYTISQEETPDDWFPAASRFFGNVTKFDANEIVLCEDSRGCERVDRPDPKVAESWSATSPTVIDLTKNTITYYNHTYLRMARGTGWFATTTKYTGTCRRS